ncbi:MAG: glycosyltransferase family 4 protein [Phycisphaerales bacterium]|nr:MAG: glycosyltransferase family 4 protein [Phycisphaerales bacterium]
MESTPTNNSKAIWILNHYAGSRIHGMEYRHYYLARNFQRLGFAPVIVCASFHHLMTRRPETRHGEVDGIPYVWVKTCRYEGNGLGRVLNMTQFSLKLACKRLQALPKPDVVIASSPHPFVAVNGARLAQRYRAKFIFEVRDLWPLTLLEVGGHSPRHPFIRAMVWAERTGYERCDRTVSLLGGAKDYMIAHGLDQRKFVHIPNGFDAEARTDVESLPEQHRDVIAELKGVGKRIVLYSGSHGQINALDNVIEAAGRVGDALPTHWLLVGQGPEKERLQQRAGEAGLRNVTFLPPVTRPQMFALTGAVDVGYVGLQKRDLFKYGVSPNKLFEYMAAKLPVIFAIDTADDEVAQARAGFSIPAEDPDALAETLRQIAALSPEQLREMGARGRKHVEDTHSYDVLAQRYTELF